VLVNILLKHKWTLFFQDELKVPQSNLVTCSPIQKDGHQVHKKKLWGPWQGFEALNFYHHVV
jgi:hypothetical protein